ncbi:MAG: LptE family protein [Gemmatimonadota bacterium]
MPFRVIGAAAILGLLSGCVYSFAGGGLPGHIRTVAIEPFENTTTQPLLESEIESRMQAELPRNLGVNLAAEELADAVVRGRITGYEETAASVRPSSGQTGSGVSVLQREVRITYQAEIYDLREDRPLWSGSGRSVVGNFQTESESPEQGRARAVEELIQTIIEGAQSQW